MVAAVAARFNKDEFWRESGPLGRDRNRRGIIAVSVIAVQVAMIRESDNAITSDLAGGHRWRMRRSYAPCPFWVGVALARDIDQNAVRG